MHAGCWSKQPGTTCASHGSAPPSSQRPTPTRAATRPAQQALDDAAWTLDKPRSISAVPSLWPLLDQVDHPAVTDSPDKKFGSDIFDVLLVDDDERQPRAKRAL